MTCQPGLTAGLPSLLYLIRLFSIIMWNKAVMPLSRQAISVMLDVRLLRTQVKIMVSQHIQSVMERLADLCTQYEHF